MSSPAVSVAQLDEAPEPEAASLALDSPDSDPASSPSLPLTSDGDIDWSSLDPEFAAALAAKLMRKQQRAAKRAEKEQKKKKKDKKKSKSSDADEEQEQAISDQQQTEQQNQETVEEQTGADYHAEADQPAPDTAVDDDAEVLSREARKAAKKAKKAKKEEKKKKKEAKKAKKERENEAEQEQQHEEQIEIDFNSSVDDMLSDGPAAPAASASLSSESIRQLKLATPAKLRTDTGNRNDAEPQIDSERVSGSSIDLSESPKGPIIASARVATLNEDGEPDADPALAAASARAAASDDDEFDSVWSDAQAAAARKQLKPSRSQMQKQHDGKSGTEDAKPKALNWTSGSSEQSAATLQNPILAKLNLPPTAALAQFSGAAAEGETQQHAASEVNQADFAAARAPEETPVTAIDSPTRVAPSSPSSGLKPINRRWSVAEDWGNVNELRMQEAKEAAEAARRNTKAGIKVKEISRSTPISYSQALEELTKDRSIIVPLEEKVVLFDPRGLKTSKAIRFAIFGCPSLVARRLQEERKELFALALLEPNMDLLVHERMFLSLYRSLTGDELACPTYGRHWELIGFQGNSPVTDVRGSGMFGVLQLLYLMQEHKPLAMKIYQLSRDERQNFPFCLVGLNLSATAVRSFRAGNLYKKINQANSVFKLVNTLFVALFYSLYIQWKQGNYTIVNWDECRVRLEAEALREPGKLITFFKDNNHLELENETKQFTEIP